MSLIPFLAITQRLYGRPQITTRLTKQGEFGGGGSEQLTNQLTPNQRLKISVATCSLLSINSYSPFVSLTTGCSTYAAFPQT